jgi:hypothetical protein
MSEWTKEWPRKEGEYWFYGWLWGDTKNFDGKPKDPQLEYVAVTKIPNSIVYVTQGALIYKSEKHIGLWSPIELPELPVLELPKED